MAMADGNGNPLLEPFDTPFGVPPFERIRAEHYLPAVQAAIAAHAREVDAIATNPAPPTFSNTVEALERSGALLDRVTAVFDVLNESMTDEAMQEIGDQIAPLRTRHADDILLNERLFLRIHALWQSRDALGLGEERRRLLEVVHRDFLRGGAALEPPQKARLRLLNEELARLTLRFADNLLAETNAFTLALDASDLDGLPSSVVDAAAQTAQDRGMAGRWVFTLEEPSLTPFLAHSSRRDLRERLFTAYVERCNHDDEWDNKALASRIVALRARRAALLGYPSHAAWAIDDSMARTPERVVDLLRRLWPAAQRAAQREADEYREIMAREGAFKLEPWDWAYCANRVRSRRFALDEQALRPYLSLDEVIKGAFDMVTRLWGARFIERTDVPRYHPDVSVYELVDADASLLGLLYLDPYPRAGKRGGAWMNALREESIVDGKRTAPIVAVTANLSRPTAAVPSLLTLEEVRTLYHELGHALHTLFSTAAYERLSGTNVATDFVELPSQIMENWAIEPEVLRLYAHHYQTGERIPDELVTRIQRARQFNQGFETAEYLAAAFLDLDYHILTEPRGPAIPTFERRAMAAIDLLPEIVPRYRTTYFAHAFSSDEYAAGYYSYIWAEVLEADAFQMFKEKGLFDRATADALRRCILERGAAEEPLELYRAFRGREPAIEPLLARRGLLATPATTD
jgi:peptidyl-dipeptidase Dcp